MNLLPESPSAALPFRSASLEQAAPFTALAVHADAVSATTNTLLSLAATQLWGAANDSVLDEGGDLQYFFASPADDGLPEASSVAEN